VPSVVEAELAEVALCAPEGSSAPSTRVTATAPASSAVIGCPVFSAPISVTY